MTLRSSASGSSSSCEPRWATQRTGRPTLGIHAAKFAEELGTPLMPWQQTVLDVALELDPRTKRLVYRYIILTVPRQSGKTTLMLALILLRALGDRRQEIRYTAQTGLDARKKWKNDWLPALDNTKFATLYRKSLVNGDEGLFFRNGSHQGLVSATKKTGHGSVIDLAIIDEAFAQPDARLEQALDPAMITRPQPQLWVVSTAGTPMDSPYLLGKVQAGRAAVEAGLISGTAYFEWSAPDELDPADPATWWSCMPALGHTVTEDAVRASYEKFVADEAIGEFERAYLNRWKTIMLDTVFPLGVWRALADDGSAPTDPVCFAFDVSPNGRSGAIGVAGQRPDGLSHVEVVAHQDGTLWLPTKLADLARRHRPFQVICDPHSDAGGLVSEVERLWGRKVTLMSAAEHAEAFSMFRSAVEEGTLRHRDQPSMLKALEGATTRPLGEARAWSRKNSATDISPLVACTLALGGEMHRRNRPKARVINLNQFVQEASPAQTPMAKEDAGQAPDRPHGPGQHL